MKKRAILILISVTVALLNFFSVPNVAFATPEENQLKIYYSEGIGAGDRVYHLKACDKEPAVGPLRCYGATQSIGGAQCVDTQTNQPKTGTVIYGCKAADGSVPSSSAAAYQSNKCNNDTSKQAPVEGQEWALIGTSTAPTAEDNRTKWNPRGTVVFGDPIRTPSSEPTIQSNAALATQAGAPGASLVALYRTKQCVEWDVPATGQGGTPQPLHQYQGDQLAFYNIAKGLGDSLIQAGCNTDNAGRFVGDIAEGADNNLVRPSTVYDNEYPFISCTIAERITGKSGVDIFGQYIAAIYRWLAAIVGIICVLIMVFSGIQISMAGGDSAKMDEGKKRITQSLIGLTLLFLSGLILYTINPGFFTG